MKAKRPPSARPPPSAKNRAPPSHNPNLLLARLPAADYARLAPTLDVVSLKSNDLLHKPGQPIDHVFFPGGGFCSILAVREDGGMVELATVGREGMLGAFAATDGNSLTSATLVQGETDTCYRITVETLRAEMDRRGPFYEVVSWYAQALVGFMMYSTACNTSHSVEQRLARWLLTASHRMGSNEYPLTQELVAIMLGATRPTITALVETFQKDGLITHGPGRVTIVDREKLEAASCECHRATMDLLKSLTDGP